MTQFAEFGDPARFEIALRWTEDREPRERRPAHGGWSMGELRLTVGGHVLTRHEQGSQTADAAGWYLLPFFEWLARRWPALLHEEHFAWRENSAAPAATAAFFALRRLIDAEEQTEQAKYGEVHAWWERHALRAADASALVPDVVLRRLGDTIEISWTARQPTHAPGGFRVVLAPGVATLPVADVAGPLWKALAWAVSTPKDLSSADRLSLKLLEDRLAQLDQTPTELLQAEYLSPAVLGRIKKARANGQGLPETARRMDAVPAVTTFDDAVLMFGGVAPDIRQSDVNVLTAFLAHHLGGTDTKEVSELVDTSVGPPLAAPFEEGYDLAEQFLDDLRLPAEVTWIDIETILGKLGVAISKRALTTDTVRGVAVAGDRYAPAVLVNTRSPYNRNAVGQRFTLAHELFHILYDRSRAQRVAHTSGPWAPPGVEKRANAFAAMLLMPTAILRRSLPAGRLTYEAVREIADSLRVGVSALVEHLYNTEMIDELERDILRDAV